MKPSRVYGMHVTVYQKLFLNRTRRIWGNDRGSHCRRMKTSNGDGGGFDPALVVALFLFGRYFDDPVRARATCRRIQGLWADTVSPPLECGLPCEHQPADDLLAGGDGRISAVEFLSRWIATSSSSHRAGGYRRRRCITTRAAGRFTRHNAWVFTPGRIAVVGFIAIGRNVVGATFGENFTFSRTRTSRPGAADPPRLRGVQFRLAGGRAEDQES